MGCARSKATLVSVQEFSRSSYRASPEAGKADELDREKERAKRLVHDVKSRSVPSDVLLEKEMDSSGLGGLLLRIDVQTMDSKYCKGSLLGR